MAEKVDTYKLSAEEESLLALCINIEEKCAALYRQFQASYCSNPYFSRLWGKIAREEDAHAESFRVAARLKGVGIDSISGSENDLALLRHVDRFLETIQVNESSPAEALNFAITLERDISEFHVGAVLHFKDEVVEKAFKEAMTHTEEHISTLEKALAKSAS